MCWALSLTVILVRDTEPRRAKLKAFLDDQELSFAGSYPHYYVSNGNCSCRLVGRNGERLTEEAIEMISSLLELPEVHAVEVYWFEGSKKRVQKGKISSNLSDFIQYNVQDNVIEKGNNLLK